MNFRQIEVFYSVMTEGSITGAAKKLGISQPSVTTTVKQAEEKIGFRLFEREGGRLIPTAEARVLFEEATRAQEALTAIDRLADRLRDGISGHVSIAATASFCLEIIPDVIATFTKQYPHYSLSISTHNTDAILRKLDARTGTHNIGFTFGTGNYDGLSTSKLGTADLFAVLPPSWPMIKGDTINIADLNHKPYIGPVQSTPLGTTIENTLLQEGVEPNRVATVHSHQLALPFSVVATDVKSFAGIVSSASPEATRAGQQILERGGNAIDAAVAVSLAVGVTEPAGSGIAGQTVMLVQPKSGDPFVIHGTTWSPANIPATVTKDQLRQGRTASTVPSTLKVLSLAHQRYGSGTIDWADLVAPSIAYAEEGFVVGPFRQRAFRFYGDALKKQAEAKSIFIKPDGTDYQVGETFRQPILADTLRQIAEKGAEDFYTGDIARKIAADMAENGGWITYDDLANFPEPRIVTPLSGTYRGYEVLTLPPPFGGWVVLQILNGLETADQGDVDADDAARRIALLKAMAIGHGSRKHTPVPGFLEYEDDVKVKISKQEAARLLSLMEDRASGETTHFSVVDGDGNAVSVTQSIDSYFGSKVVHPELGFLYNNYMQSFRLVDDGSPYVLKAKEMPLSSMSSAILRKDGAPVMVLGSPGSARIISAVAQVSSFWIDVEADIEKAVGAYRVHVVPDGKAYVEGPVVPADLLSGMAKYGFSLNRPAYGVSDSQYDPYFGGVHALAKEGDTWAGAADPRRDGLVLTARK